MEIKEIFEKNIKIEPKVMAIETIFNNLRRLDKTNYEPPYQRNYVWDDEKATYFIESILLGTEIPPLIFFNSGDSIEVIDGRQRYQTILRFIHDEFKLKNSGLQKFSKLNNKYFKNLKELRDVFWDTKLRIIEFSFHSQNSINEKAEEIVKKEIFKRYNSGITPLKTTDIDKAIYFENDLNSYFKKQLSNDKILYDKISDIFYFEANHIEKILKKIRQLLVLHQIPIKRYSVKKEIIIKKFYDCLSDRSDESEIENQFSRFLSKINILSKIQKVFNEKMVAYNRLIFECLYWAFQILECEMDDFTIIDKKETLLDLVDYLIVNKESYKIERSSFAKELYDRYLVTSKYFSEKYGIDFSLYIQTSESYREKEKALNSTEKQISSLSSFETLRINKPDASSITIEDINRQMKRSRFLIRPAYQRNEVINIKKSSAIIESILLGIKLPPIFVFKREDGISEVLDGQQRLLSILGYIQNKYLDENNKLAKSNKDGYSLNLKNGILKNLHGKKFRQLDEKLKEKILEFDLWKIEIEEKNNPKFEPIDLFIRLNYKPFPIKENTFEMWNSYIDREIIDKIKEIYNKNNNWFYFRKNNKRMDNEGLYSVLCYFQYKTNMEKKNLIEILDIYKVGEKINFRVRSKIEITKVLEDNEKKSEFLKSCNDFEKLFLNKVRLLSSNSENDSDSRLNKGLDYLFNNENRRRTQQSFYALWFFLSNISECNIKLKRETIINSMRKLFLSMRDIVSKDKFIIQVKDFWKENE